MLSLVAVVAKAIFLLSARSKVSVRFVRLKVPPERVTLPLSEANRPVVPFLILAASSSRIPSPETVRAVWFSSLELITVVPETVVVPPEVLLPKTNITFAK